MLSVQIKDLELKLMQDWLELIQQCKKEDIASAEQTLRTIDLVNDTVVAILQAVKLKLDKKELHTHNSIPCYIGEEANGCIICIDNKSIQEILDKLK